MPLLLIKLLNTLTSSMERYFSEIFDTCLNDAHAPSQSVSLTQFLIKLLSSKLVVSLNEIKTVIKILNIS